MGCGNTKEKLESEILILQLTRNEIKTERNEIIRNLEEITGMKVIRPKVPDYIDRRATKTYRKKIKSIKTTFTEEERKLSKKQSTKCDESD